MSPFYRWGNGGIGEQSLLSGFYLKGLRDPIWPLHQPEEAIFTEVLDGHTGALHSEKLWFYQTDWEGSNFAADQPRDSFIRLTNGFRGECRKSLKVVCISGADPTVFLPLLSHFLLHWQSLPHSELRQKILTTHLSSFSCIYGWPCDQLWSTSCKTRLPKGLQSKISSLIKRVTLK